MIFWLVAQYNSIHFTVFPNQSHEDWHSQAWGPFPWNGRVWVEILILICIHSAFVFLRNFDDGALVHDNLLTLLPLLLPLTLTLTLTRCAST